MLYQSFKTPTAHSYQTHTANRGGIKKAMSYGKQVIEAYTDKKSIRDQFLRYQWGYEDDDDMSFVVVQRGDGESSPSLGGL